MCLGGRFLQYALRRSDDVIGEPNGSTPRPIATQASKPPASGRTLLKPRSSSLRAATTADASFGQAQ